MSTPSSDGFGAIRPALYTAVIADVLDALGRREQVVAGPWRRTSGRGLLIGRAKTMSWQDVTDLDPHPYELELRAVDECRPDEVLIAAAGGSARSGIWGELLSTAARARGCAGALVDGCVRDLAKMEAQGFLTFARGTCPRDSLHRQRVMAIDVRVTVGGVAIEPGDIVVADDDGVVVVPGDLAKEALARALEKANAENQVRDEIRAGASAAAVFKKYGVL
jgi:4-hydroxy-4-methyl-2-oxoglutarate aldolase